MHPAYSVIFFTTASGAGYGLLVWLAVTGLIEPMLVQRRIGLIGFGMAFVLITAGLLSSTAHLGRPERAWRAFSQWRTSWLSREGVMAVATYLPAVLLALCWIILKRVDVLFVIAAVLTVVAAVGTLYTTGMIYASLRTIRQWHQPLTAPIYIALGLVSGALLLNLPMLFRSYRSGWLTAVIVGGLIVCALLKSLYWLKIDGEARTYTAEAATGLGKLGKVRVLEPPHTQPNFIMREMGYSIGRKHARRLRLLTMAAAFLVPALATLLAYGTAAGLAAGIVAALSMGVGLLLERWLFFAEAEHVSMLYYGAESA